ncbi:DUF427 domain-containing protein [Streptomyces sp. NRRL F-2747]|uniref:DUF427 domain-containing protein n=1 Tax=Streptomyces sp. NRRL F-2747 TaxID=1463843 RepID=UPI0022771749|nr:DUF427 domain-containing protein [Streptomyces sp. NRRL F-2747]
MRSPPARGSEAPGLPHPCAALPRRVARLAAGSGVCRAKCGRGRLEAALSTAEDASGVRGPRRRLPHVRHALRRRLSRAEDRRARSDRHDKRHLYSHRHHQAGADGSRACRRVLETSHPPVFYVPPDDVRSDLRGPTAPEPGADPVTGRGRRAGSMEPARTKCSARARQARASRQ